MSRITPPKTYSEWVTVLDVLQSHTDDEAVLNAMQCGTLEWQAGVSERFTKKLIDVISNRMNTATDKFQVEIRRCAGQERAIVQALIALRKELCFLSKAIDIPAIPDAYRRQYCQMVTEQADEIQNSLEKSAKNDRTGKLASIIRNNKVNAF